MIEIIVQNWSIDGIQFQVPKWETTFTRNKSQFSVQCCHFAAMWSVSIEFAINTGVKTSSHPKYRFILSLISSIVRCQSLWSPITILQSNSTLSNVLNWAQLNVTAECQFRRCAHVCVPACHRIDALILSIGMFCVVFIFQSKWKWFIWSIRKFSHYWFCKAFSIKNGWSAQLVASIQYK